MWGTQIRGEFATRRVEIRQFPHLKIEMWGTQIRGEFATRRVEIRQFPHLKIEMWGTQDRGEPGSRPALLQAMGIPSFGGLIMEGREAKTPSLLISPRPARRRLQVYSSAFGSASPSVIGGRQVRWRQTRAHTGD